jgi:hypothetical protein
MAFESRNQLFLWRPGAGAWALTLISWLICANLFAVQVDYVVGRASAPPQARLDVGDRFGTGVKSSSQVSLDRGFFRMGSEAGVQVVSSNGLALEKGVMLVGANPERRRKAVEVSAPGYKMEIRGTALVAYYPGQYVKITVLEGKIKVSLQSLLGEFESVEAGQMLIINPADKRLPEPVEVDLNRLVSTSQLLGGPLGAPSTLELINSSISDQGGQIAAGQIARTPYLLRGASPEVNLSLLNRQTKSKAAGFLPEEAAVFRIVNDIDNPNARINSKTYYPPDNPTISELTTIADLKILRTGARTKVLNVPMGEGPDSLGQPVPPEITGRVRVDPDVFWSDERKLVFRVLSTNTNHTLYVRPGADVETPSKVALRLEGGAGVSVDGARLQSGKVEKSIEALQLVARTQKVEVRDSLLSGGIVDISAVGTDSRITIDRSVAQASQDIVLSTTTKDTAIALRNSTELAAMVGAITIQSKGGAVTIDDSILTAGGGITIDAADLRQNPLNGVVTLRNAQLAADVIRARGYTSSGDALIIEGGRFNASSLLKFYAESASTLRFRGLVDITTPLAIFAGHTVEVEGGASVRVRQGEARVYTQPGNDRFNRPGFGTVGADRGVIVNPYGDRPRF